MPPGHYARPPIVEAVISVKSTPVTEPEAMEKFYKKLKKQYPIRENRVDQEVKFEGPNVSISQRPAGWIARAEDPSDGIILTPDEIVFFRQAPYEGWAQLLSRAREGLDIFKSVMGHRKMTRIGVRYVNRIDCPIGRRLDEYLKFTVHVPPMGVAVAGYEAFAMLDLRNGGTKALVRTAHIPSVVPHTHAVVLDLDVYVEGELRPDHRYIWEALDSLRASKNGLFEEFITEHARALFDLPR